MGLSKSFERTKEYRKKLSEQRIGVKHPFSKTVINTKTGELFYSIISAADSLKISRTTMNYWLHNQHLNKTPIEYFSRPSKKISTYKK